MNDAIEVLAIEPPDEEETPATEEDVEDAGDDLENAAELAAGESDTPAVAASKALDAWVSGLNVDIKKGIASQGRLDGLKQVVNARIEALADTIEKEVADAVNGWVEQNKPDFPKAFFKKRNKEAGELNTTFTETLPSTIASIAAAMMKKTNESGRAFLTRKTIYKTVNKYMDRKYRYPRLMRESNRWQKLAGIS